MRALTCSVSLLGIFSAGCVVLGIDFDKRGVSGGTVASSSTSGTGMSTSASSGSGGSGEMAGPDCGGIDLLTGLDSSAPLFKLSGANADCSSVWTNGAEADLDDVSTTPSAHCQVLSNWYFDGRGRRFIAHLLTDPGAIGNASAGIQTIDVNGYEYNASFEGDGNVYINSFDPTMNVTNVLAGPIGIESDRYISLRFSGDGTSFALDSSSSPSPTTWTQRVAFPNATASPSYVDLSSLRVGVQQSSASGQPHGGARFDDVHGESVAPTTATAIACPTASLKEAFIGALPSTFIASSGCYSTKNNLLSLCAVTNDGCTLRSAHLYQLGGSTLDLQVHSLDSMAIAEISAAAPTGALAQMSINGMLHVGSGVPLKYETTPSTLPIYLDIAESDSGVLTYGTHHNMGIATVLLPDQPTTPIDPQQMVEIRIQAFTPSTTSQCVAIDSLNLP